ncbi:hypothetical protein CASFOL_034455 [Castilleja foliolosa]|uniref:Myb-like domain-containing protein n=1 Tax=Castilleja foliolosa TaxID=1961234 RepID=A0ABD3BWA7_9LAMI
MAEHRNESWTWQEDKRFESGLVEFPADCPNRWDRIAAKLGTKSAAEVERHYAVLLADLMDIEAGLVPVPEYTDDVDLSPDSKQTGKKQLKKHFKA